MVLKLLKQVAIPILFSATMCFSSDVTMTTFPPYHPFKSSKAQKQYLEFNEKLSKKWPVVSETRMVETQLGMTFVRISGPVDAKPLVLLPGGGANSLMWRSNIAELSEHFRVYAVDNIYDYGRSIYKKPFNSPEDFSIWLDELMDALKLANNVNMMGTSYGGWITCQYALHSPDRLNKIVLVAPAATILPVKLRFIFRVLISPLHSSFARGFYTWVFADLYHKNGEGRQRVEDVYEETKLCELCFAPKKFIAPTVLTDEQLHELKVPTLFLVGENEKLYTPRKAIQRWNEFSRNVKTVVVPNAGHDLPISQKERLHTAVFQFLLQ